MLALSSLDAHGRCGCCRGPCVDDVDLAAVVLAHSEAAPLADHLELLGAIVRDANDSALTTILPEVERPLPLTGRDALRGDQVCVRKASLGVMSKCKCPLKSIGRTHDRLLQLMRAGGGGGYSTDRGGGEAEGIRPN